MPFSIGPGELMLLMIIFAMFCVPVLILVLVVRSMRGDPPAPVPWTAAGAVPPPGSDPRALLAERLARGEITRDQFDTAMSALGLGDSAG
jgi:uncharacterized membrane protein